MNKTDVYRLGHGQLAIAGCVSHTEHQQYVDSGLVKKSTSNGQTNKTVVYRLGHGQLVVAGCVSHTEHQQVRGQRTGQEIHSKWSDKPTRTPRDLTRRV